MCVCVCVCVFICACVCTCVDVSQWMCLCLWMYVVLMWVCELCLHVYTGNMPQKNRELTFSVTGLQSVNVWFKE